MALSHDFIFTNLLLSSILIFCSFTPSFSFNFAYFDLDLIFDLDFDFFRSSFFDRYCLLNDSVCWEVDLFSWVFLVGYLEEATILPSVLIKARLSEKLIFFIMLEILLLTL